jgi:hypothetical protein
VAILVFALIYIGVGTLVGSFISGALEGSLTVAFIIGLPFLFISWSFAITEPTPHVSAGLIYGAIGALAGPLALALLWLTALAVAVTILLRRSVGTNA